MTKDEEVIENKNKSKEENTNGSEEVKSKEGEEPSESTAAATTTTTTSNNTEENKEEKLESTEDNDNSEDEEDNDNSDSEENGINKSSDKVTKSVDQGTTATTTGVSTPNKSTKSSKKEDEKLKKDLKKQKQKEEKERLEMEKQKQKEEKERLELEKQKQKEEKEKQRIEEKERLKREEKEKIEQEKLEKQKQKEQEKEKHQKEKQDKPEKEKPTISREPSVISKIFSVKKTNSSSLIIERSNSPTPIDQSPTRKSFNEQQDGENNNSNNNLSNLNNNNNENNENDENELTSNNNIVNNKDKENNKDEESIDKNENNKEESTSNNNNNNNNTLQPSQSSEHINDKEELSSTNVTSPGDKKSVVIKVTRAFAPVIHQNVMKEEGENKLRNMVINEIINTEKDYIADLNVIINFLLTPLKESKIITDKDISTIFSNIQLLLNVNKELLSDLLQKAPNEQPNASVGTCFIYFFRYLKIYSSYCANQTISADHIARCSKKIPAFKQFLEEKQSSPECRQCNLESFLIKPVQRLCKYPLLLRELIKNSPTDHPDLANLEKAFTEIQTVVLSVNESKRKAEIHQKMYKIHEKLEAPEKFVFFTPTRHLIKEATFGELNDEKDKISGYMHYYLFNDIIMRTQKDKKSIKLETLFIIASTNVDGEENRNSPFCNTFEISQPGTTGRRFTLVAESYEQKMEWFTELDDLIRPYREEHEREADKYLDHIKRSTIATTNPSSQNDSPKALHRTATASGSLGSTGQPISPSPKHMIPSKPLPPPPPKTNKPPQPQSQPVVEQQSQSQSQPIVDQQSPAESQPQQTNQAPIVKPRPSIAKKSFVTNSSTNTTTISTTTQANTANEPNQPSQFKAKRSSFVTTTNNNELNDNHQSSNESTVTQPIPFRPKSVPQPQPQPQQPNEPISKTSRPLPTPGTFNNNNNNSNNTSSPPPTQQPRPAPKPMPSTSNNNEPAKPISFPSKLSQLKQAAPNNSVRSHSTFTPSSSNQSSASSFVPSSVKNKPQQPETKDDLSIPSSSSSTQDLNAPKGRFMPLPPSRSASNLPSTTSPITNNNNNNNTPSSSSITSPPTSPIHESKAAPIVPSPNTKKPTIPPRK